MEIFQANTLAQRPQAEKDAHDIYTRECAERTIRLRPAQDLLKSKTSTEIRDMLRRRPNQNLSDELNEAVKVNKEMAAKEQVVLDRIKSNEERK